MGIQCLWSTHSRIRENRFFTAVDLGLSSSSEAGWPSTGSALRWQDVVVPADAAAGLTDKEPAQLGRC